MNKQKNSHISYKKIIALSILFIVILGISVLAGNVKVNSVKIRFSNNHEITVLTSKTKVSEILEENHIMISSDEVVTPALEEEITSANADSTPAYPFLNDAEIGIADLAILAFASVTACSAFS